MGDASDNIPGIPGIGPKTARNSSPSSGRSRTSSPTPQAQGQTEGTGGNPLGPGLLSKELATIITDVPVEVTWDDLVLSPRDDEAVKTLFNEFEFRSLTKRLFGDGGTRGRQAAAIRLRRGRKDEWSPPPCSKPSSPSATWITTITSPTRRSSNNNSSPELARQSAFCFDIETTSLDRFEREVVRHRLLLEGPRGVVSAVFRIPNSASQIPLRESPEKIGHNLKYRSLGPAQSRHRSEPVRFSTPCSPTPWSPRAPALDGLSGGDPAQLHAGETGRHRGGLRQPPARTGRRLVRLRGEKQGLQGTGHGRHPAGKARRIRRRGCRCHLAARRQIRRLLAEAGQEKILQRDRRTAAAGAGAHGNGGHRDRSARRSARSAWNSSNKSTNSRNRSTSTPTARSTSPRPNNSARSSSTNSASATRRRRPRPANTRPTNRRWPRSKANTRSSDILAWREATKLKSTYLDALPNHIVRKPAASTPISTNSSPPPAASPRPIRTSRTSLLDPRPAARSARHSSRANLKAQISH
jgi:DNA polymerase I